MNKVLALDIDGVLNSHAWWKNPLRPKREGDLWEPSHFDPAAVKLLDKILVATGAEVVVSSTWRKTHTLEQLQALLVGAGLTCPERLVGRTPDVRWHHDIMDRFGCDDRGLEIAMWLNKHRPEGCVYAIVDDDIDMWELRHRSVYTPPSTGLTQIEADKLVCLLRETEPQIAPMVCADWEDTWTVRRH